MISFFKISLPYETKHAWREHREENCRSSLTQLAITLADKTKYANIS